MGRTYDLLVKAKGDTREARREIRELMDASQRFHNGFGRHMKSAAKWGAIGMGVGLAATVRVGAAEMAEAAKVGAQTSAVIRSTGGAAGFSKKQFEGMATALSKVSGVDDEVIQGGENILATFTKIKDGAFKGATQAALDMSVALGEDMTSSAMRIGKALNDPIKGVTALRRVGVQLTAQQEKQIESFVKSGKVMQAQKVILKELNTEFGGSAKAFGQTGPGELAKAQHAFEELAARLVGQVAPSFGTIAHEATRAIDAIDHWANSKAGIEAIDQAKFAASQLATAFRSVGGAVGGVTGGLDGAATSLAPLAAGLTTGVLAYRGYMTAVDGAKAAQLAFNKASMMNPIGLAVGAAATLGVAFLSMKLRMSESEKAIRANERALKDLKAAATSQLELELAMDSGNVALQRATVEYQRSQNARQNAKKGTREYREALLAEREAHIAVRSAEQNASKTTQDYAKNLKSTKTEANKAVKVHRDLLAQKKDIQLSMLQDEAAFNKANHYTVGYSSTMKTLRGRLRELNKELDSSAPAARTAAKSFDLATGKALAGGAGFAKMRRQLELLNDEIRAIPTSKTFTLRIVERHSGISSNNGLPSPTFTQGPKSKSGTSRSINALGNVYGNTTAQDALNYAQNLQDPSIGFLKDRVSLNRSLLQQNINTRNADLVRLAALRKEKATLESQIRTLNAQRKKASAARRKTLNKLLKPKIKRLGVVVKGIERLTGRVEEMSDAILSIAQDIVSDEQAIKDEEAEAAGSGGSTGGAGGGPDLSAIFQTSAAFGDDLGRFSAMQSGLTQAQFTSLGGQAGQGVVIVQNFTGEPDMFAASQQALWAMQNAGLAG